MKHKALDQLKKTNELYDKYLPYIKDKQLHEVSLFFEKKVKELKKSLLSQIEKEKGSRPTREETALSKYLPEAFALVKCASFYLYNEPPYDSQILGAIALHNGYIAELETGGGKTLMATLPAFLNALIGRQIHIITPNTYLATRDYEKNSKLFSLLGLSCGLTSEITSPQNTPAHKKEAYSKDIVYGSSSAFAFDYLYDGLETNPAYIRNPEQKSTFAIIDEADAVLIDDATTPFIISGHQQDTTIKTPEEVKVQTSSAIKEAIRATSLFQSHILYLRHREYEHLTTKGNILDMSEHNQKYAIIIDKNTKEFTITKYGYALLYIYYKKEEIQNILAKYNMSHLTTQEISTLIINETNPELTTAFEKFSGYELHNYSKDINIATTSWYTLESEREYALKKQPDGTYLITPVTNGRLIDKRKFTKGLQQALEEKEKILHPEYTIIETKISDTLASIPASSFFAKYNKIAGMTGTSSVFAFEDMYGLQTYVVPPSKPKNVRDNGERFYATDKAKLEAIFQDVYESHLKGQPVLITTTSIAKSAHLAAYLQKRFTDLGHTITIPVLNAYIQNIASESEIISHAGELGAITISTEMAGRGTDIKLGGNLPTYEHVFKEVILSYIQDEEQKTNHHLTPQERIRLTSILSNSWEVKQVAKIKHEQQRRLNAERVATTGGLKIIGSGHFKFARIDRQVKGRCGRQGDPGEIVFYNSPSDLADIGIPKSIVAKIKQVLTLSPTTEDKKSKLSLSSLITKFQDMAENSQYSGIKYHQELEIYLYKYRNLIRNEKMTAIKTDNPFAFIERYIKEIVKRIITIALDNTYNPKASLTSTYLDYQNLIAYIKKIFGNHINLHHLSSFIKNTNNDTTIKNLEEYISQTIIDKWRHTITSLGESSLSPFITNKITTTLNRVWCLFETIVEDIQNQYISNALGNFDTKTQLESQIDIAFDYCFETEITDLLESIFNLRHAKGKNEITRLRDIEINTSGIVTTPHPLESTEIVHYNRIINSK